MPRPLRPIDEGLVYHVINRGNNRQKVFHREGDYLAFLKAIAELKEQIAAITNRGRGVDIGSISEIRRSPHPLPSPKRRGE